MSTSAATIPTCPHCGAAHRTTCPLVKAIEYHPNGQIKRIEFRDPQPMVTGPHQQPFAPPFWQDPIIASIATPA